MPTLYPTTEEVLHLHRLLVARFGGTGGVRDVGLLESALYRPRSGYYESLAEQSAALLQSLATNHPFVDGNKRVAFATTAIFLLMNGFRLQCTADDGETFLVNRVIAGRAPLGEICAWLGEHMVPA